MKRLVAAAWFACALPAFGQDVRAQLVSRLHEACMSHAQKSVEGDLRLHGPAIDTARFCVCADAGIRDDRIVDGVAALPEAERQPSSDAMTKLERGYFIGGVECYSKLTGWPASALDEEGRRPRDELRAAIEKRKGALYRAYSAALKANPSLTGKVVFEFTIEPDGAVSSLEVVSNGLADDKLLDELKAILKSMKFAAEPVPKLVARYPIDFLPHSQSAVSR